MTDSQVTKEATAPKKSVTMTRFSAHEKEHRVMVTDFLGAVASFVTWESVIWVSPFGVGAAVVREG
jgi:hypothetical protein